MKLGYFTWGLGWVMLAGSVVLLILGAVINRAFLGYGFPLLFASYWTIRDGKRRITKTQG